MSSGVPRLTPRAITAAILLVGHRRACAATSRGLPARPLSARDGVGLLVALSAPTLAVARVRAAGRWRWPTSGLGTVWLLSWIAASVTVEEVAWRGPLVVMRPGLSRRVAAVASMCGFAALHVRRDGGASAGIHVPNTLAWTGAAVLTGRLAPAAAAHVAYNLAAHGLRSAHTASDATSEAQP